MHESLTRRLRKRCLLEFEDKSNRYSLHSLIAAYAKDKEHSHIKLRQTDRMIVRHFFRKFMDLAVRYEQEPLDVLKLYDLNHQNFQHLFKTLNSLNRLIGNPITVTVTSRSISQLAIKSDKLVHARMLPSEQVRWYKTALRQSKTLLVLQLERLDEITETACQVLCLLVEAFVKEGNTEAAISEVKRQKRLIRSCTTNYRIGIAITICFVDSSGDLTEKSLKCHWELGELLNLQVKPMKSFFQLGYYYYLAGYAQQAYECYVKADKIQDYDRAASRDPVEWSEQVVSILNTYIDRANVAVDRWHDWIRSTFKLMSEKFEASPEVASRLFVLGSTLRRASMHGIALKLFFRAVKIQMEVLGENRIRTPTPRSEQSVMFTSMTVTTLQLCNTST